MRYPSALATRDNSDVGFLRGSFNKTSHARLSTGSNYEYQTLFRQIFTDGRALPEDPDPTWMGYSIGHWDCDSLVVTTATYNDRTTLDLAGHPHTESLRLTEPYHRCDAGHIDLAVTFDDPMDASPPTRFNSGRDLIEYICENERDKPHLVGKSEEYAVPAEILARYAGSYGSPRPPLPWWSRWKEKA
jgi:hypothetical protein